MRDDLDITIGTDRSEEVAFDLGLGSLIVAGDMLPGRMGCDLFGGMSNSERRRIAARDRASPPSDPTTETRQMRRARERAEQKGRPS